MFLLPQGTTRDFGLFFIDIFFADMPQLVEPSDVRVYLGEVAVFECRLSNPPQEGAFNPNDDVIVIEWTKNDRPLASAGGSNSRIKVWLLLLTLFLVCLHVSVQGPSTLGRALLRERETRTPSGVSG